MMRLSLLIFTTTLFVERGFAFVGQRAPLSTGSKTQLGISEALCHYIDEEYYRETHKEEYNMNWVRQNKATILYHTRDGSLVLGDPHLGFQTHQEQPQSAQEYVASHADVKQHVCEVQANIMGLRPREFMRECHECVNRKLCQPANEYYDAFLASLQPGSDQLTYAYTRGE